MRSVTILGVGRVAGLLLSFATMALLLRQLGPEPFGVVAMAAGLMAIVSGMGDAGVGDSLVTDPELDERRLGAALVLTGGIAALLSACALLATPLVVRFYDQPAVAWPWVVSAGSVACHLLAVVPQGLARRQERFSLLAWTRLCSMILAALVAIPLAFSRADVWPILAWQGVSPLCALVVLWLAVRPGLARPTRHSLSELWRFSRGVAGFTALNVLSRNADDVIVGRFLGEKALGYYALCYRILTLPLGLIGDSFATVAQPRLTRLLGDPSALGRALGDLIRAVTLLTTPICLGAALAAPELIEVVFGAAWLPALRPFQLLAICGAISAPGRLLGLCYTVSRNTQALARWALVTTPIILFGFFAGLPWGVTGVAASVTIVFGALAPISAAVGARVLGVEARVLLRSNAAGLGWGALASLPLGGAYLLTRQLGLSAPAVLAATIAVGALCELGLLRHTWRLLKGADQPERSL